LENFEYDRAHDRGQAIAERTLREYHEIDQPQAWLVFQRDQRGEADRKAERCDRPDRLAADAVGQMSERDLSGNAEQADDAERPDADIRREADVEQEFGLVHLHRVPNVKS